MKLSIVIPVYNEAATLEACVERVLAVDLPLEREVILIDDASTDQSKEIMESLLTKHENSVIKMQSHTANQGKGAAIRSGMQMVSGELLVIQDADLEYDPNDYKRLLKPILDGRADVVYGSRFAGSEERRVLYYWHCVGNKFLTMLSNMFTNLNLSDMETCYKMLRREVADSLSLKSNRFGIEPELTAKIAKGPWRVYEVGISYSGRTYREGKKITWKDGFRALGTIIYFRFFD